jgi:hypothetical protein
METESQLHRMGGRGGQGRPGRRRRRRRPFEFFVLFCPMMIYLDVLWAAM